MNLLGGNEAPADSLPLIAGATLEPVPFDALCGWSDDRLDEAFTAFLASARSLATGCEPLRRAAPVPSTSQAVAAAALSREIIDPIEIRHFFERHFRPLRIVPDEGEGFLTAYYEPEAEGSLTADPAYPVPILARPDDLVAFAPGEPRPDGLDPQLAGARLVGEGGEARYQPYHDRAEIETGALAGRGLEQVWLKDPVEAFLIHVQGSARIRLPDGRATRLVYDGRNGQPYASIGKMLVAEGHMRLEDMTLESLKDWLRAHPQDACRLMRQNRSYIFFRRDDDMPTDQGPIGGAGLALTPHRSLAIDRSIWSYGLPFFLEADLPEPEGGMRPVRRLMIAQDTGSAIVGPARADYYMGSGAEAGRRAGLVRHPVRLTVLWPNGA